VNGPVLVHENTVSQAVSDSIQSTVESDKQSEESAITEQQSALSSLLFFINEMNEIAMCTDAMSDITYFPALVFFNETRKGNSMPDDIVSSNYAFHSLGKCQPANTTTMDETEANCLLSGSLAPFSIMAEGFAQCSALHQAYVSMCNSITKSTFQEKKQHTRTINAVNFCSSVLKYIRAVVADEMQRIEYPEQSELAEETPEQASHEEHSESLALVVSDSCEQSEDLSVENASVSAEEATAQTEPEELLLEPYSLASAEELMDNPLFRRQREKYLLST
ncbi:hypothetical protein NEIRO02_2754, partial [Nematocida sp. AWRm79]